VVYQQRPQPQTVVVRDRRSHGMGNMTTGIHSTFLLTHLIAISNGMQAVKLCTNKILQFLTGGAG